ncbi:MAG: class II aldolase/adducin family protein [Methanomassiliicoccus sp.]|nr:class II aldolase/adducin family protein [Methanomassiliicoccus sp.]
MNEEQGRRDLASIARLAYERRLTFGAGGNLSLRLDESTALITPSGTIKGLLAPEQMIRVSIETGKAEKGRPSMETPFHTGIYRSRPEVGAVIHLHPPSCTVLALLHRTLRPAITPEGVLVLGNFVPMIAYATPGSEELAQNIVTQLGTANSCLLESHGALAVGRDVMDAFGRMETMEYIASLQLRCESLGDLEDLPEEEVSRMLSKH